MNEKPKTTTWSVRLEYHSVVTHHDIEAKNESEAIRIAEEWTDGNLIACNASSYDAEATEQ